MRLLLLLCLSLLLGGCKDGRRVVRESTFTAPGIIADCIEGHVYYFSGGGLAPKLNDDGTPVKCTNNP
jgi:hypothetical protein